MSQPKRLALTVAIVAAMLLSPLPAFEMLKVEQALLRAQSSINTMTFHETQPAAETVLGFEPSSAMGHYYLGVAYFRQGRAREAYEQLSRSTQNISHPAIPLRLLGLIASVNGRPREALEFLDQAMSMDPRPTTAMGDPWIVMARSALQIGQPAKALTSLLRGDNQTRSAEDFEMILGDALRDLALPLSAERSYRLASQHNPRSPEAQSRMAALLSSQHGEPAAIAYLEEVDRQGNLGPKLLYVLGTSYHSMGKLAQAADAFERLIKIYSDEPTRRLIEGLRADANGDREKAAENYRTFLSAVKSDPNRPYLEQKLARWGAQSPNPASTPSP